MIFFRTIESAIREIIDWTRNIYRLMKSVSRSSLVERCHSYAVKLFFNMVLFVDDSRSVSGETETCFVRSTKFLFFHQKKKKIVHPLATFPDRKIRIYCQLFPSVIFFINETRSTNRPPVIQDSLYQTSNSVAIRVRSNFIKEGANKQKLLCSLFLKERERADRDKDKGTKLHR